MKIKSISNVITNSSDEVFILKTDKSLEEVNTWLASNTSGYCDVHKIEKPSDGILDWLVDFGYLFNSKSKKSVMNYHLSQVFCRIERKRYTDLFNHEYELIPGGLELVEAWIEFLITHRYRINKYWLRNNYDMSPKEYKEYRKTNEYAPRLPIRSLHDMQIIDYGENYSCRYEAPYALRYLQNKDIPYCFYEKFIKQYKGPKPDNWDIPKELDVNTYLGSIGFSSCDENSIPYETWENICDTFNGDHWHMG